jgi:prepilin-type N-terminal cleavage/methylation domain-containing protein
MGVATEGDGDTGFTLIELLIASMILVVVLTMVGGMIISMSATSRTVRTLAATATSAQLAAESVERGIRNSSDFMLSSPSGNDQFLVARTAQGGSTVTWTCVAWYYSAADGSIRYTMSPSAISAPSTTTLAQWTLLTKGVTPGLGSGIFSGATPTLTIGFTGQSSGAGPVAINSTVVSRAGSSGTPACY